MTKTNHRARVRAAAGPAKQRPLKLSLDRFEAALRRRGVDRPRGQLIEILSEAFGHRNSHETQEAVASGALTPRTLTPIGPVTLPDGSLLFAGRDAAGRAVAFDGTSLAEARYLVAPTGGIVDTDGLVAEAKPTGDAPRLLVATVSHRHGEDRFYGWNQTELDRKVAEYARENWHDTGSEEDPGEMSDADAVSAYFGAVSSEAMDVDAVDVGPGPTPADAGVDVLWVGRVLSQGRLVKAVAAQTRDEVEQDLATVIHEGLLDVGNLQFETGLDETFWQRTIRAYRGQPEAQVLITGPREVAPVASATAIGAPATGGASSEAATVGTGRADALRVACEPFVRKDMMLCDTGDWAALRKAVLWVPERLDAPSRALLDAARPFAGCCFDDNGDITVTTSNLVRPTAAMDLLAAAAEAFDETDRALGLAKALDAGRVEPRQVVGKDGAVGVLCLCP